MLSTGTCELGNKLKFPGPGLAETKCVTKKPSSSPRGGKMLGQLFGMEDSENLVSIGSLRTNLSSLPAGEIA